MIDFTMLTDEERDRIRTNKEIVCDVLKRCCGFIDAVSNYGKDSTNPEVIDALNKELISMQCSIHMLTGRTEIPPKELQKGVIEKLIEYGVMG